MLPIIALFALSAVAFGCLKDDPHIIVNPKSDHACFPHNFDLHILLDESVSTSVFNSYKVKLGYLIRDRSQHCGSFARFGFSVFSHTAHVIQQLTIDKAAVLDRINSYKKESVAVFPNYYVALKHAKNIFYNDNVNRVKVLVVVTNPRGNGVYNSDTSRAMHALREEGVEILGLTTSGFEKIGQWDDIIGHVHAPYISAGPLISHLDSYLRTQFCVAIPNPECFAGVQPNLFPVDEHASSVNECAQKCLKKVDGKYNYVGLGQGDRCYCFNKSPDNRIFGFVQTQSKFCNQKCRGYEPGFQLCGGYSKDDNARTISVYHFVEPTEIVSL
jgi:hypothetical protein